MKCEKCGVELTDETGIYTAVGVHICGACNEKSHGTISMDDIFNKIVRESEKDK